MWYSTIFAYAQYRLHLQMMVDILVLAKSIVCFCRMFAKPAKFFLLGSASDRSILCWKKS